MPVENGGYTLSFNSKYFPLCLAGALILVFAVYARAIGFDFANYDDNVYVTENGYIKDFTVKNVRYFFTHQFHGHFFPLTLLTYTIEHFFFGLNPAYFHFTNLLIHLACVLCVFYLLKEFIKNDLTSLGLALLYGLHPFHVESVVWIGARNNLLFAFFFFAGLLMYFQYTHDRKAWHKLLFAFLLFLLSVLSKSSAVVFPAALMLIDWYQRKLLKPKVLLEKVSFFAVAGFFAYVAGLAAVDFGSTEPITAKYSYLQVPFLIAYPLVVYMFKFFLPVDQQIKYDNPVVSDGLLPVEYYIALPVLIVFLAYILFSHKKGHWREVVFGMVFFLINISLFLKIFFSSNIILAERYAYVPFFGLVVGFYFLGKRLAEKFMPLPKWKVVLLAAFALWFGGKTFARVGVWKDGESLFSDYIERNQKKAHAYVFRGIDLYQKGEYEKALRDLDKGIEMDSTKPAYFNARGFCYFLMEDLDKAQKDFEYSLELDSGYAYSIFNLANVYGAQGKEQLAKLTFKGFLKYEPQNHEANFKLGNIFVLEEEYDSALVYYNKAIEADPDYKQAYLNRGSARYQLDMEAEACSDWIRAKQLGQEEAAVKINRYCQ